MKDLEFWTNRLIKQIDFYRVADDEMEWCSNSQERLLSWARGAVEEAVTSGDEEEHRVGCFHSEAIRNGGKLIIDLEHRRTRQRATIEIADPQTIKSKEATQSPLLLYDDGAPTRPCLFCDGGEMVKLKTPLEMKKGYSIWFCKTCHEPLVDGPGRGEGEKKDA